MTLTFIAVGMSSLTVIAIAGFAVRVTSGRVRSQQRSEEFAHAAASDRRGVERRLERRRSEKRAVGTATILGSEREPVACRILNTSRSGLRIALRAHLTVGSQVCVEWQDRFIVGTIRHLLARDGEQIAGLHILTGNLPRARWSTWVPTFAGMFRGENL